MKFLQKICLTILVLFFISTPLTYAQTNTAKLVVEPNTQTVSAGGSLELTVKMNTGSTKVNSYVAELNYPQDKLTFESINTDGSPFTMALEAKGENGVVNIIRGTTNAVSGEALVGKVTFKAVANVAANEVTISNNSAIISSDNKNILSGSTVTDNSPIANSPQVGESPILVDNQQNFFMKIINSISSFFSSLFK